MLYHGRTAVGIGATTALAMLVAGCAWFTQPTSPVQPTRTWRFEPTGYYMAETVSYFQPDRIWGCRPSARDAWLVIAIRIANQLAREASLDMNRDILSFEATDNQSGAEERSRADYTPDNFHRSIWSQSPFPPKQTKLGYAYFEVFRTEALPTPGKPLYGRLRFYGDRLSDAQGQAELIDLRGLPATSPPSDAPVTCS